MKKIPQDIIGNIALLKFPKSTWWFVKKFKARRFLKSTPHVSTILEKVEGFSGRLRTLKTKWLAGVKTKEATYKENNCVFKFNVDEAYFSPRLSNERKIIAGEVNKLIRGRNKKVLVMFAGVAPYPIVIAKTLKSEGKFAKVFSNELNRKANEYAQKNIILNKLSSMITLLPGDAKRIPQRYENFFDVILMPRPQLKDSFLTIALKLSKKGATVFYHGFGTKEEVVNEIKSNTKGKVGKVSIRKAGDIGVNRFRWQAKFKVK